MANVVLVGAQWGDEGKGKIVDFLSSKADVVVRFQGGNNAGHTVVIGDKKIILHQIPSGILRKGCVCVIGNGVVLDISQLAEEIKILREQDYPVTPANLRISENAHLILPHHRLFDKVQEERRGERKVGTTGRGIGPAYVDKVSREGIRAGDLLSTKWFTKKINDVVGEKNEILQKLYNVDPIDPQETLKELLFHQDWVTPHICNTSLVIHEAREAGKNVLFEGAQGCSLDVDHGTYPYVTSSNTVAGAACTGGGIGPTAIDRVIGVTKAYTTRVGEGPFPTQIDGEEGDLLRKKGEEFGATTGRPRRCGWLDAVFLCHAVRVNGITDLAVTKLDVLDGFESIKICIGYERDGEITPTLISDNRLLERYTPVYEELEGWDSLPKSPKKLSDLPKAARDFLLRIEELTDVQVSLVSTGAERAAQVVVRPIF